MLTKLRAIEAAIWWLLTYHGLERSAEVVELLRSLAADLEGRTNGGD